jgi:hypothetical protein
MVVAKGWREEGLGGSSSHLLGIEFQFCKMWRILQIGSIPVW